FFFSSRRRHTRFDCDWSSDVCSSDLAHPTEATATMDTQPPEQVRPTTPHIPGPPTVVPAGWETLRVLAGNPAGESQEAREKRVRSEERRVGKEGRSRGRPRARITRGR